MIGVRNGSLLVERLPMRHWVLKFGMIHDYKKLPLKALWFRYEDFGHEREIGQRILFTHVELDDRCAPNDHSLVYSQIINAGAEIALCAEEEPPG